MIKSKTFDEAYRELIQIGLRKHPVYEIWRGIKARCYNPNAGHYCYYGGRGIGMCFIWRTCSFEFCLWALMNGWKKGLEIDRFPNKLGNYDPGNCRIVNHKEQCSNQTSNVLITIGKETKTLSEWSRHPKCEVSFDTLWMRIRHYGWEPKKAIFAPKHTRYSSIRS